MVSVIASFISMQRLACLYFSLASIKNSFSSYKVPALVSAPAQEYQASKNVGSSCVAASKELPASKRNSGRSSEFAHEAQAIPFCSQTSGSDGASSIAL